MVSTAAPTEWDSLKAQFTSNNDNQTQTMHKKHTETRLTNTLPSCAHLHRQTSVISEQTCLGLHEGCHIKGAILFRQQALICDDLLNEAGWCHIKAGIPHLQTAALVNPSNRPTPMPAQQGWQQQRVPYAALCQSQASGVLFVCLNMKTQATRQRTHKHSYQAQLAAIVCASHTSTQGQSLLSNSI